MPLADAVQFVLPRTQNTSYRKPLRERHYSPQCRKILRKLQRNLVDHFERTEPENCLTDSTDTHSQHCGVDSDHNGNP